MVKIIHHTCSDLNREVAGYLIGNCASGRLIITDARTGPQRGSRVSVELDQESLAEIAERLNEEKSREYIVGWYHSHPNLGVFMSGTDVQTQQRYQFFLPESVALVIDPAQFTRTGRFVDLDYGVFQVNNGRYSELGLHILTDPSTVVADFLPYISRRPVVRRSFPQRKTYLLPAKQKLFFGILCILCVGLLIVGGLAMIPFFTPRAIMPIARYTYSPYLPIAGREITFNATVSRSDGTRILEYFWEFGDSKNASGPIVEHTYRTSGIYLVVLNITNSEQKTDAEARPIVVLAPLNVSISPSKVLTDVGFQEIFTSTVFGGIPPYSYQWYLDGTIVPDATSKTWAFTPTSKGLHEVYLSVRDNVGVTTQSARSTVTVKSKAPVVEITHPSNSEYISAQTLWVNGTVTSLTIGPNLPLLNDTVAFSLHSFDKATGKFAFLNVSYIPDGTYSYTVNFTDTDGLTGNATVTFTIDTVYPIVNITFPTDDYYFDSDAAMIWINGTVTETNVGNLQPKINDTRFALDLPSWNGTYFAFYNASYIPNCPHYVRVNFTDLASKTGEAVVKFHVNTTYSEINITFTTDDHCLTPCVVIRIDGTSAEENVSEFLHSLSLMQSCVFCASPVAGSTENLVKFSMSTLGNNFNRQQKTEGVHRGSIS